MVEGMRWWRDEKAKKSWAAPERAKELKNELFKIQRRKSAGKKGKNKVSDMIS